MYKLELINCAIYKKFNRHSKTKTMEDQADVLRHEFWIELTNLLSYKPSDRPWKIYAELKWAVELPDVDEDSPPTSLLSLLSSKTSGTTVNLARKRSPSFAELCGSSIPKEANEFLIYLELKENRKPELVMNCRLCSLIN